MTGLLFLCKFKRTWNQYLFGVVLEKRIKPIILVAAVFIGCVLSAGIWLITNKSPEYPILVHSPANTPIAEMPVSISKSIPPEPSSIQAPDNPAPAASHETKPLKDFSHLRLLGIAMYSDNPYVIILNEQNAKQDLFRFGDLVDGAVIQDILADKVVLKYRDQFFTLVLESVLNGENELVLESPQEQSPPDYVLSPMDQANIENSWAETQELMNQIELRQYEDNNEPKGVTVNKIVENSVFEKIGFLRGDIIVQVDDMEISIADDAMEIYNCLRTKEVVDFKVKRNSEAVMLRYSATKESD